VFVGHDFVLHLFSRPGSVWEFNKIIPILTEPQLHGGRADQAFHVVAPSIPGGSQSVSAILQSHAFFLITFQHFCFQGDCQSMLCCCFCLSSCSLTANHQSILNAFANRGYGFSEAPHTPGADNEHTAHVFHQLMEVRIRKIKKKGENQEE
jgi:hypothetical protein